MRNRRLRDRTGVLGRVLGRRRRRRSRCVRRRELPLSHLGRRSLDLDRRGLQLEGRCWAGRRAGRSVLGRWVVVLALLGDGVGIQLRGVDKWGLGRVRREAWEARCIGGGLQTQLSEIQIRAGSVALVHGLHELAFAPHAVGDDGVDQDDQNFDDNFNDGAHETPVLQTAKQSVVDDVGEVLLAVVVRTGP